MRRTIVILAWIITLSAPVFYFLTVNRLVAPLLVDGDAFLDLRVYREAVTQWIGGTGLYDLRVTSLDLPFMYPPIAAVMMYPLTLAPLEWMQWIWLGINVAATYIVVFLSLRYFKPKIPIHLRGVAAAAALFTLVPLWDNTLYGQINVVLMLLVTLDWLAMKRGRGLLIGIATSIKLTPGIFLLLYAMQRRWREVVYGVGTVVAISLVSLLLFRADTIDFFASAMWQPERPGPSSIISNQSLRGTLLRFGVDSTLVWLGLALLTAALGAYTLYRARFTHPAVQLFIVALTGLLVSPISWVHHWVWVALLPACLLYLWRSNFFASLIALIPLLLSCILWDAYGAFTSDGTSVGDGWFATAILSNQYVLLAALWIVVTAVTLPRERDRQASTWNSGNSRFEASV